MMTIKKKLIFFGLAFLTLMSSCHSQGRKSSESTAVMNKIIPADSIWLSFLNGLNQENVEFLVQNSIDTIQCAECNLLDDYDSEWYECTFVYENHIDELMHLESLSNLSYTTYSDDELIHINYEIAAEEAMEGGYNLIFTFIKVDEKYLFKGMIVT